MQDIRTLNEPPYFEKVDSQTKLFNYIRKTILSDYDPEENYGCRIKNIIGRNITDKHELVNDIVVELERVEQQVIDRQLEADRTIPKEEQLTSIELLEVFRLDDSLTENIEAPFSGYVKSTGPLRLVSNEGDRAKFELSSRHVLQVETGDSIREGQTLAISDLGNFYNIGLRFKVNTRGDSFEGRIPTG